MASFEFGLPAGHWWMKTAIDTYGLLAPERVPLHSLSGQEERVGKGASHVEDPRAPVGAETNQNRSDAGCV